MRFHNTLHANLHKTKNYREDFSENVLPYFDNVVISPGPGQPGRKSVTIFLSVKLKVTYGT